jgi:hypothetical protein
MVVWVRVDRCRLPAVVVALGCIGMGGLVVAHPGSARTRASSRLASGPGCVNATMGTSSAQCVRAGHRMPRRRPSFNLSSPGTVVRSSAVFGDRVFLNAEEGVALANGDNAQYPALPTDGGRVWRIDGPPLHVDAADGPEALGSVGIAGPRAFFAYGSAVVDVTIDRGRTWWETYLGQDVVAVLPSYLNKLVAYVEPSLSNQHLNPAVTWRYVSRDGGRHWRHSTQFAGIPG